MADKLSKRARAVVDLGVQAPDKNRLIAGVSRVLMMTGVNWDKKAPNLKWRAFGALEGALAIIVELGDYGEDGELTYAFGLLDHAEAILRCEDHEVDREIAGAQAFVARYPGFQANA